MIKWISIFCSTLMLMGQDISVEPSPLPPKPRKSTPVPSGPNKPLPPAERVQTTPPTLPAPKAATVEAIGFSGGTIVKYRGGANPLLPLSVDGVLVLSVTGGNQVRGVFKFPMWDFSVPVEGTIENGVTMLESQGRFPLVGCYYLPSQCVAGSARPGLYAIRKTYASPIRIKVTSTDIQVSVLEATPSFNWRRDLHDQSLVSFEADRSGAQNLNALQESFAKNAARRSWFLTDAAGSFSREADAAFASSGLSLTLPPAYTDTLRPNTDYALEAAQIRQQLSERAQEFGVRTKTLDLPNK